MSWSALRRIVTGYAADACAPRRIAAIRRGSVAGSEPDRLVDVLAGQDSIQELSVVCITSVDFREVEAPTPSSSEVEARDRVWDRAVLANPDLFDGPVTLIADVAWVGTERLSLTWARGTYRNFALRQAPGATSWLPSLAVSVVQPLDDGRVVVGRMASSTAAPGRWQLPGGTLDPPPAGVELTASVAKAHAALELSEEVGLAAPSDGSALRFAVHLQNGNVGLLYVARPVDEAMVKERFEALRQAEIAAGRTPEFDELAFVGSRLVTELEPRVEYLEQVLELLGRDAAQK